MADIAKYTLKMFPYMLGAVPVILLFRLIRLRGLKARSFETCILHETGIWLFLLFLAGLLSLTVLSEIGNTTPKTGRINLIPFRILADTYEELFLFNNQSYLIISLIGNIVMFMPLGFFPPLLWRGKPLRQAIQSAFSVSLLIELLQIPLGRGTDVDDLLLNTLGGALGYAVFVLIRKLNPSLIDRFKIKER